MTEPGPVVEEKLVRLVSDGSQLFEWRCTPSDLEALVIGRLYIEGRTVALPMDIRHEGDVIVIEVQDEARDRGRLQSSSSSSSTPSSSSFTDLFRSLFAGVDERHESGGMHAAALSDGERIVFQAEDVGRHNAVDKVIGMAILGGVDPATLGMLVSSRVSGEIARKAAAAGVSWLASRSIPTTLAVQHAREAGMPIVGRAAGKQAFVYR